MEIPFKVLKSTLERELELYRKYLDSCLQIRECVKESDIGKLQKSVREQEGIVATICDQEGSRLLLVQEFSEQLQVPVAKITLAHICGHADETVKKELLELQARLKAIVKDVQRENKINSVLLGETLGHIQGTYEIFAGARRNKEIYNAGGKTPEQLNAARNILNRVA